MDKLYYLSEVSILYLMGHCEYVLSLCVHLLLIKLLFVVILFGCVNCVCRSFHSLAAQQYKTIHGTLAESTYWHFVLDMHNANSTAWEMT